MSAPDVDVPRPPVRAARERYDSKFVHWDRRSSVRTKPARILAEGERSMLFFPPELVPALAHPVVEQRGPATAHRLLVQALYTYLHFTVVLEQMAVMPVTGRIALGQAGVELPAGMQADAFNITTDEAWHAQFCFDFIGQVADGLGVPVVTPEQPQFIRRLDELRERFEPATRPLVDLFFATVSETLLSSILLELPNDQRLPRSVRALVMDHAEDEGRHHAYFRAFLRFVWPQLGERERLAIGPRIPDLIEAFLRPDVVAVGMALRDAGLDEREVATVVDECYRSVPAVDPVVFASRATVRSFREVGALDDPATYEAFASRRLVG